MTCLSVILAGQLPAMVDVGQVDEDTAVRALAEQASWSACRFRAPIDLQAGS